jgi:hypothetical protein
MHGARARQPLQQVVIVAAWSEGIGIARAIDHTVVWQGEDDHETVRPYPNCSA